MPDLGSSLVNGTHFLALIASIAIASLTYSAANPAARPLTEDERGVYAAFLDSYGSGLKKFEGTNPGLINLASDTAPFNLRDEVKLANDIKEYEGCFRGIVFEGTKKTRKQRQTLDETLTAGRDVRLANSAEQSAINKAITQAAPAALTRSVRLEPNLLRVSEIVFDTAHRFAAFRYGFSCGQLCGEGGVLIFGKIDDHWKQSDRPCAGWIS